MASIALCLIARDEEELLPACLQSAAECVDEIVLVDTGSVDRTAEIARAHGAKVIPFAWQDDFAAARNAALAATRCDWVLVLDADERLAPGAGKTIRREAQAGGFECGFLVLYNALRLAGSMADVIAKPSERYDEPTALARLFRRDATLRWEGPVHENVGNWLNERARRVKRIDAAIVHYGYTAEVGIRRGKKQRNLTLLERWCAVAPEDPVPWTYLAWERQSSADPEVVKSAASAAESGWQAWLARAAQVPAAQLPSPVALATVRALDRLRRTELQGVEQTLQQAAAAGAQHPNLELLRAQLAEREADRCAGSVRRTALDRAARAYAQCLAMRDRTFTDWLIDGATSWFAATGLGLCSLELGDAAAALRAFDTALQVRPGHIPARLGRAEALIELRQPGEALAVLLPLLEDTKLRMHADPWLLAAQASRQLGQSADAKLFTQRAEGALAAGGTLHPWRAAKLRAAPAIPKPNRRPPKKKRRR